MKILFIILISFFFFHSWAQISSPILRNKKPSILVPSQSRYLDLFISLESRWVFQNTAQKKSPNLTALIEQTWVDLNLIGVYEVSPFPIDNLNIHFQSSIGSDGLILYTGGKWIPFPDYQFQPAIGLLGDVYAGFTPQKKLTAGAHLQLLMQKNFRGASSLEDWGIYFAPLVHYHFIQKGWLLNWITGLNFNFNKTRIISSKWSFNIDGRYNKISSQIGFQFLIYI